MPAELGAFDKREPLVSDSRRSVEDAQNARFNAAVPREEGCVIALERVATYGYCKRVAIGRFDTSVERVVRGQEPCIAVAERVADFDHRSHPSGPMCHVLVALLHVRCARMNRLTARDDAHEPEPHRVPRIA